MQLQRLVLDYRGGDLVVRCLYRSKGGAGPGTKTRQREVSELAREGLTQALEALEVGAECGESAGPATAALVGQLSPRYLQRGGGGYRWP